MELQSARLQGQALRTGKRPGSSGSLLAAANERNVGARNPLEATLRAGLPAHMEVDH